MFPLFSHEDERNLVYFLCREYTQDRDQGMFFFFLIVHAWLASSKVSGMRVTCHFANPDSSTLLLLNADDTPGETRNRRTGTPGDFRRLPRSVLVEG